MSPQAIDFIERLIRKNPEERMKAGDALKHKFLTQIEE
jgi:serine/threonine protein kinase